MRSEGAGEIPRDGAFLLRTPAGAPLVEGSVARADLQKARTNWRRTVTGWVIVILGVTQLLLMGPLLDARGRAGLPKPAVVTTLGASGLLLGGAAAIWLGITWPAFGRSGLPLTLSFCAITFAALAALWASPAILLHTAARPRRAPHAALLTFAVMNLLAGVAMAGLMLAFARVLAIAVDPATVDVRHFSLYPWNGARVLRLAGILALHVAALWAATLVLITARGVWRLPSGAIGMRLTLLLLWVVPSLVAGVFAMVSGWHRRAAAVGPRVRGGGTTRSPRGGLVPPRYDCRPHLRSLRELPRSRGAALPGAQFLCRARDPATDHELRRGGAESLGGAARPVGRGAA
jgi:hypothetical protein